MVTNEFEALAKSEREALGAPDHPLLIVPHPIGSLTSDQVRERADRGFPQLLDALVKRESAAAEKRSSQINRSARE